MWPGGRERVGAARDDEKLAYFTKQNNQMLSTVAVP